MVDKAGLGQAVNAEQEGAEQQENAGPPIHLPGPSLWPAAVGFGVALLLFGVLSNWVFSLVGAAVFVWALASWVSQLRHESAQHESEAASPAHDAHV